MDRLIFVGLYRLAPNTIKALTIVKPDTVIRWREAVHLPGIGHWIIHDAHETVLAYLQRFVV